MIINRNYAIKINQSTRAHAQTYTYITQRMHIRAFTPSVMYEIISRLSETCMRLFPTGLGTNQCSPNRTRTTRLHLTTSLLSWLLNSLLLSLICTGRSASICPPQPRSHIALFFWAAATAHFYPQPDNFPLMSACRVVSAEASLLLHRSFCSVNIVIYIFSF